MFYLYNKNSSIFALTLTLCCFLGAIQATVLSAEHQLSKKDAISLNAKICGQRCVQHVLAKLGHDVELSAVLEELSYDTKGLSLADMHAYLQSKGMYVQAQKIPKHHWLASQSYIAIVHLSSSDSESGGHYVVATPSAYSVGSVCVWDGIFDTSEYEVSKFADKTSGAVLLVSNSVLDTTVPVISAKKKINVVTISSVIIVCIAVFLFQFVFKK